MKTRPIYIEWEDSWGKGHWSDLETPRDLMCHTVAYFVWENDSQILVTQTMAPGFGEHGVMAQLIIPKRDIVKRKWMGPWAELR
jgi:hypothetical protein